VDDARFGRGIRAIRVRARLRQIDLAERAGLSQATISDIERGRSDRLSIRTLRAVAFALGADASLELRWRGGEVDRLLDGGHAALVGLAVELLARCGWEVATEVTYSHYGERGSFDILAMHPGSGAALAVEVKTRLVSLEATLRKLDEKARLAPGVAADRFDTRPRATGRMLVLPEGGVSRRALVTHDAVLRLAFPVRGAAARAWLVAPAAPAASLILIKMPPVAFGPGAARRVSPRGLAAGFGRPTTSGAEHGDGPSARRNPLPPDARRRRPSAQSPR
jgi:transcriptional regulator with XRE-family HTH domain